MSSPSTKKRQEAEALHEANQATSLPGDPLLLPGELPCSSVSPVTLLDAFHGSITGTLHCTNYKLFFRAEDKAQSGFTLEMPLGVISSIEKVGRSKKKDGLYGLELHCKDMRSIKFALNQEEQSRKGVYEKLQILAFPVSQGGNVFAYHYRESYPEDGWNVYNAEKELRRMGIGTDCVPWRMTLINQNYGLCETYPSIFAVPVSVKDEALEAAAMFRSRNRLPALSWLHPVTFASITRCSQPLVGAGRKRNQDDENYIQAIIRANKHSHKLYIVDARPRMNAIANIVS
jgi:myotubularin-related protein 1/2